MGANLADPASVLADPAWLGVIDMAEPVCLIFGLVLSLIPARQAREVVAAYADRAAPGSYVVISCGRCDDEEMWVKHVRLNAPETARGAGRLARRAAFSPGRGLGRAVHLRPGTRVTTDAIADVIDAITRAAGLDDHVTSHVLWHTFGTEFAAASTSCRWPS